MSFSCSNLGGNIFPHVQFHFLVRPSFATCAVPALIFELSVPILPHVQFQQNMHYPILPHVQFQQEYELATLGSCINNFIKKSKKYWVSVKL